MVGGLMPPTSNTFRDMKTVYQERHERVYNHLTDLLLEVQRAKRTDEASEYRFYNEIDEMLWEALTYMEARAKRDFSFDDSIKELQEKFDKESARIVGDI